MAWPPLTHQDVQDRIDASTWPRALIGLLIGYLNVTMGV